jgi:hypothetical protein
MYEFLTTAHDKPNIYALVNFDDIDITDCNLRITLLTENRLSVFFPWAVAVKGNPRIHFPRTMT